MHKDAHVPDWATAIAGGGPTWLEIVAAHAEMLSVTDPEQQTLWAGSGNESGKWINRIRPELGR